MAYGRHWEWRGFGRLSAGTRSTLTNLPTLFPQPMMITDDYLWLPGVQINIKLRGRNGGSLKLKRLERTKPGGIELWVERPDEEYSFPIAPGVVRDLAEHLGAPLPPVQTPLDRAGLLTVLSQAGNPVQLVSVRKRRDTRTHSTAGGRLLIEVADIESPESIASVSIEDDYGLAAEGSDARLEAASAAVADAVTTFGLDRELRTLNYLDALRFWSAKRSVVDSDPAPGT